MKLVRWLAFVAAIGTTALFVVFWEFWVKKQDTTGPVITCEEESYSVPIDATEKKLLDGVEAWDEEDGDVTDSLLIEKKKIIPDTKDFILTCVAMDSSNNVSKYERTITYEDYHSPHFIAKQPLRFVVGDEDSLLSNFEAEDCMEGDITSRIKLEKTNGSSNGEGIQTYELSVANHLGDVATLPISVEFYTDTYEDRLYYPNIYLTDYIYYIEKDKKFSPRNLLKQIQIGATIYEYDKDDKKFYEMEEVEKEDGEGTELKKKKKGEEISGKDVEYKSDVDTSKKGVYTVQYSYQAENERLGTTQLIVVVE